MCICVRNHVICRRRYLQIVLESLTQTHKRSDFCAEPYQLALLFVPLLLIEADHRSKRSFSCTDTQTHDLLIKPAITPTYAKMPS